MGRFLIWGTAFVIALHILVFWANASAEQINSSATEFYNCKESNLVSGFDINNCSDSTNYVARSDMSQAFPQTLGSASDNPNVSINPFIQIFNTLKNWVLQSTGLGFITDVIGAPFKVLIVTGMKLLS